MIVEISILALVIFLIITLMIMLFVETVHTSNNIAKKRAKNKKIEHIEDYRK